MKEWREVKIGELGKVITGKTPSKNSPNEWGNEVLFLTPTDYGKYHKYIYDTERKLSVIGRDNHIQRLLPKGSIMVTCIGSDMGKTRISVCDVVTNQQINSIVVNNAKYDKDFIYYKLFLMENELKVLGGDGTTMPILNKSDFSNICLKIPPLPEQRAIASVLSSLDDKIDLLHRQNATLERMAETLFRQWFVVEAKEEWEDARVSDIAFLNQRIKLKNYSYTEIQYLDTGSITEGKIDKFQSFFTDEAPSRAQRLVEHNNILISMVRPNQKHYGIIQNPPDNLVVSTGFTVLSCHKISPFFLYLFLTSNDMTEFLSSVAEGSTSAYPSLKPSDIADLTFKLPPKEKLLRFDEYAQCAWRKIYHNQTQICTLEKLRDTLLPKLMSGEVRASC